MKYELCDGKCEYVEGKVYDDETFVCFDCQDGIVTQTINWSMIT